MIYNKYTLPQIYYGVRGVKVLGKDTLLSSTRALVVVLPPPCCMGGARLIVISMPPCYSINVSTPTPGWRTRLRDMGCVFLCYRVLYIIVAIAVLQTGLRGSVVIGYCVEGFYRCAATVASSE